MTQAVQVLDRQGGGSPVIELDVGHAARFAMPRHGHGGDAERMRQRRIDRDQAFDGARHQHMLQALDQLRAMAMADDEVNVFLLEQWLLDAAEHGRRIAFGDLRDHHADRKRAAVAQAARQHVGPVPEQVCRINDFLLRGRRNRLRGGRAGQYPRDCRGRQPDVFGHILQRHGRQSRAIGRVSTYGLWQRTPGVRKVTPTRYRHPASYARLLRSESVGVPAPWRSRRKDAVRAACLNGAVDNYSAWKATPLSLALGGAEP